MKITEEHQSIIKAAIDKVLQDKPNIINEYENGNFIRAEAVINLQRRFNFDLLQMANLTSFICNEVYKYANDSHIETCLKSVCPIVVRKYSFGGGGVK